MPHPPNREQLDNRASYEHSLLKTSRAAAQAYDQIDDDHASPGRA